MPATTIEKPAETLHRGRSHFAHPALLAAGVAFFVRLILLIASQIAQKKFHVDLQVIGQEAGYVAWALATGKGFSNPFPGYQSVTAWLAPVYPALWSVGLRLFHPRMGDPSVYFAQTLNCLFSSATCLPIYWLGNRLFSRRIGIAAAWGWVFLPLAILFPLEWVWDQSLSALLLALLVCATYQLTTARTDSLLWTGYGLGWGFAALTNPTLCGLLPFFLIWIAYCRRKSGFVTIRPALRALLLFLLAVTPWTARNYFELDGLAFIKSNFGLELWLSNNGAIPEDDVYAPQLHPMNNHRQLFELALAGELPYMRAKQRAAISFIRTHPRDFARLVRRRVLDTWTAWYDARIDKWLRVLHLSKIGVVFCTFFSALALGGLVFALKEQPIPMLPTALCAVLFPIPYYLTHTTLRYRHPIDPLLTLLAVYLVERIGSPLIRRPRPREQASFVP